jgi:hypothetical protein
MPVFPTDEYALHTYLAAAFPIEVSDLHADFFPASDMFGAGDCALMPDHLSEPLEIQETGWSETSYPNTNRPKNG